MKGFCTILSVLYLVAIEANLAEQFLVDVKSSEEDHGNDMSTDDNEQPFSAIIILDKDKINEEITLNSDEEERPRAVQEDTELNRDTDFFSDEHYNKNDDNGVDFSIEQSDKLLRKRRWKGCLKKASKVCRKACKTAYKDACAYHDCKKKLKRSLKKECKRSCKSYFVD